MSDVPDRLLLLQVRQGNRTAFGDMVRRYQNAVFSVCYRLTGNRQEAEDMSQQAFIRAYERLHTFDAERPFLPWMRRVAANVCLNQMEQRQAEMVDVESVQETLSTSSQSDPALRIAQQETTARLYAAVVALPVAYRAVIELRHFQELSYEEISEMLKLPLNTIKSHLFRARKLLAEALHDERPEPSR
jgi:RNA polymerase sigma-70 factor (ECF subfamily)